MIVPKSEKLELSNFPSPEQNLDNNPASFLIAYFNVAYYLALSPFRLKVDRGKIRVHSWLPQKVLVAVLTLLCEIGIVSLNRNSVPNSTTLTPVEVFDLAVSIVSHIFKLATFRVYWFKSSPISHACNYLLSTKNQPASAINVHSRFPCKISLITLNHVILLTLVALIMICRFVQLLAGENVETSENIGTFGHFWKDRVQTGRKEYFLERSNSTLNQLKDWEHFLGVLATLGAFPRYLMGIFSDLFVFTCVLTLWMSTKLFTDGFQTSDWIVGTGHISPKVFVTMTVAEAKDGFNQLWQVANMINGIGGTTLGLLILESLFYYSTYFDAVVGFDGGRVKTTARATILSIYFVEVLTSLCLCGEISNKMGSFGDWITANGDLSTHDSLSLLSNVERNVVGMRAFGIVTITYSTLVNLAGAVMTYFIICLSERNNATGGKR